MKKRTALIGALVSLLPLGQPLVISTGAVLTRTALMISAPETLNAQINRLTCDVKTHVMRWAGEDWSDMRNMTWNLEIDYKKKLLVRRENVFYKGKNYPLTWNYVIATNDRNKIVAFEDDMRSDQGGLSSGSITLNLISGKVTSANHMTDERGYSFSLQKKGCRNY